MNLKILIYSFVFVIFVLHSIEPVTCVARATKRQPTVAGLNTATIGSVYYVSKSGSDSNSGTSASPFLTIQKAADMVNPGDTVIVRNGVYSNAIPNYGSEKAIVRLIRSGNSTGWITFMADHTGGAILDGLNYKASHGFMVDGASYIRIEGFEIKELSIWGVPVLKGSHIVIKDNHIHHIGRMCTNSGNGLSGILLNSSDNIVVENNRVHDIGRLTPEEGCSNTADYKYHDHGIYVDNVNSLSVRQNVFYNIQSGWAVHFYSSRKLPSAHISVVNNTFAYCGKYAMGLIVLYTPLSNVNIQNNIFYHNADADMKIPPSDNYGISINPDYPYSGIVIDNNIVYGGSGRIVARAVKGVRVLNNIEHTDPKMISPDTYDFRLKSTSPAINAAVDAELKSDYLSQKMKRLHNIGAFESATPHPSQKNNRIIKNH